MSKKKKKRAKDRAEEARQLDVDDDGPEEQAAEPANEGENEAAAELASESPTRFSRALEDAEGASAELSESTPTRSGKADEPDAKHEVDAATELEGDDGGATRARGVLRPIRDVEGSDDDIDTTLPVERVADDHRFDFGGHETDAANNPDVPPDPGSADAASPRLQSIVESLLFAADRPLSLRQLADLVEEPEVERIRAAVLATEQSWRERGVQLHEVAGGYQFRTHPANASWVQRLLQQKPVRLSRALLETLAIVSYRQPITRPEIDDIRGVDSGGTLKTLMDRSLVRILGKKEEPGRPLLYGTTKEFLEFFSLRDLKDLPTLREYHELSEEHAAQVAALEGKAPAGTFAAPGDPEPESDPTEGETDSLPKLARLEISAPREDAAELAEIDRLIRTAGVSTDSDLPGSPSAPEQADPDDAITTSRFEARPREADPEASAAEFDEERSRTGTFGEPLPEPSTSGDFDDGESTRVRGGGLDASLVDGRDPEKEPAA